MVEVEYEGTQEVSRKRPLEDDDANETKPKRYNAGGNQPLLKLLVPNYVAGALIGKGGTLMTEMKEKFGGNIRLSANRETYPGTGERIIVLTGEVNEIIDLNNHIMEKVQNGTSKQPIDESRKDKVKVVLTNAAAGFLIGRGGLTIKAIHEETKAKMSISNQDQATVPGERVLTMSGTMEQRIEACRQVIEKISADASNMANTTLKYMDGNTSVNVSQENSIPQSFNNRKQPSNNFSVLSSGKSKLKTKVEIHVEVPDDLVGPIMGKQGQVIRDFVQRSGARFHFSDKTDGTAHRILTITGDMNQTQIAYSLVNERVDEIGNQYNSRSLDVGSQYSSQSLDVGDQYSNRSVDVGNRFNNRSVEVGGYQYNKASVEVGNPYNNHSHGNEPLPYSYSFYQ